MNVSYFIGISSAVLLTWLGVTYFQRVSHESYPKQGRLSSDTVDSTPKESNKDSTAAVSIIE
ncbi:MAG: hypothetical protein ACK40T_07030 [Akkermansiaceae bacterium]|jgi:hypothetical protein